MNLQTEDTMKEREYRKKVLMRTLKRCLITAAIMAMPGFLMGIVNRGLMVFALIAVIPVIYLIKRFFMITKWNLTEGIIEDVTLYNDFDQPCTEAHIVYKTRDDSNLECVITIGHYGDYEEGIEPELEKMLQKDRDRFMKKEIPVFYDPRKNDKCMAYLEDTCG